MPSERDDIEEYWLMRRAFRDAIWDVIGTMMTVALAVILLFTGIAMVTQGLSDGRGAVGILVAAFGLVIVAGAAVLVMREFRLYPFD